MLLNSTEILGLIASTLTTASFVPQVIKTIRSKDTKSISLVMYSMFALSIFLWLIYGLLVGSPGIIIGNAITFVLATVILALKVRHG